MRKLTKTEKLYISSLAVSSILFFVSIGVLLGNETNVVVPYASLLTAIALSSSTLVVGIVGVVKKREIASLEATNRRVIEYRLMLSEEPTINGKPFIYARSATNEQINQKAESTPRVQKTQSNQPLIPHHETANQNKAYFKCPNCRREFSQPIFKANYNNPKQPKLIGHCPYCDQPLKIEQKTSEEELIKKYF